MSMANEPQSVSLQNFLKQQHLVQKDNGPTLAKARERVEQSSLLQIMEDVYAEINRKAHAVVVEAQSYLPPEELVCSFVFAKGREEYVMQLEVWGPKPTLRFLVRKWRDMSSNSFLRWIYRLAELDRATVSIKFVSLIEDENTTTNEVVQWFFYLLSGLSSEFFPSGPSLLPSEPILSEKGRRIAAPLCTE